jgi:hypothetical protein
MARLLSRRNECKVLEEIHHVSTVVLRGDEFERDLPL